MTYTRMVPADDADGAVAAMYATERERVGLVPNLARAFSPRPQVYAAWRALHGAITANMDARRYELATLAAALQLRSSYCALAHGSALLQEGFDPEQVAAVADGDRASLLDDVELAIMELAAKVADDAPSVSAGDIDRLRELGLQDAEIVDVVLAAAARCFFSTVLDGLGVEPDARYAELAPQMVRALTVGRPIAVTSAGG
jgi:uncharacterized peroxidase-related enzyme